MLILIVFYDSNSLQCYSSRPGRPPKRGPVGLSLPPTHLSQHPQMKKHRLDNGEYAYENGHINGEFHLTMICEDNIDIRGELVSTYK